MLAVLIVLASVPIFFSAYRGAAFETAPRDDYAAYLLAMTGLTGVGEHRQTELFPGAPFAHRPLSVVVALPAYHALPLYVFSNLDEVDEPYLRALAALCLVGWSCMLLTVLTIYSIARRRLRCSRTASYATALLALLLFQDIYLAGTDPLAILLIALFAYFLDRPVVAAPIVLVAVVVNEKVIVVALVLTCARLLAWLVKHRTLSGFRYWPQLGTSVSAFLAYLLFRIALLPRPEQRLDDMGGSQLDPTSWVARMSETVNLTISLKGLVANGVPLAVMGILVLVAWVMAPRWRADNTTFERSDVLVALALLATGLLIGMQFTVGRLVMHSFPLYLPMMAVLIDVFARSQTAEEPAPSPLPIDETRTVVAGKWTQAARIEEPGPRGPSSSALGG